jgi:hypothetical protein
VVQFQTFPSLDQLRPFSEAATMIVEVTRRDGTPLENGWVQVRLDAPPPGRFFSTDFPFVEGSQLLDMRLPIHQGRVRWQYVFPIRGQYRMIVGAVTADNSKADGVFYLIIRENDKKWIFLGLFTIGLFFLGAVAGRLFTSSHLILKRYIWFWVLLSIFCSVSWEKAGSAQERKTERYEARLEIGSPRVGKLSQIRWTLVGSKEGERPAVNLSMQIIHLEKGKMVFALEKLPVAEEFSLNFQFTDGAEYRIDAMAELDGREIHSQRIVSVSGIEPPPSAAIPPIVFFLAVIAVGLCTGRWSRRATASPGRSL